MCWAGQRYRFAILFWVFFFLGIGSVWAQAFKTPVVVANSFEMNDATRGLRKIALVIGNAAYLESPLPSPAKDAKAVADILGSLGFNTQIVVNATGAEMRRRVADFAAQIRDGNTLAVFYFSGHGGALGMQEYLLPVDVRSEAHLEEDGYSRDTLIDEIKQRGSGFTVAIIDACRNRVLDSGRLEKGFAAKGGVDLPQFNPMSRQGIAILWASGFDQAALDRASGRDQAELSVFTRMFVQQIRRNSQQTLRELFDNTLADVIKIEPTLRPSQYMEGVIPSLSLGSGTFVSSGFDIAPAKRRERKICDSRDVSCLGRWEPAPAFSVDGERIRPR